MFRGVSEYRRMRVFSGKQPTDPCQIREASQVCYLINVHQITSLVVAEHRAPDNSESLTSLQMYTTSAVSGTCIYERLDILIC
jgi:hypothetical protein